jgi:hypothetical protein
MDMIQFIQKARQLKVLGFDSYQGIVATHGVEKAHEILSYLLEASELGFNLKDLETLFNNLNGVTDKKVQVQPIQEEKKPEVVEVQTDLWSLIKTRFGFSFDIERFAKEYQNPSYPQGLEIEDFLMCIGVDWFSANKRMKGASGNLNAILKGRGYERSSPIQTLTTIYPSHRQVFEKTNESLVILLDALRKFMTKEYEPQAQKMMTIQEWLNERLTIHTDGEQENWSLPLNVYMELSDAINSLLIKHNIGSEYLSKTATTKDLDFTPVDALDVSKGFCEILYRDAVLCLYKEERSFREMVQDFCTKKGIVYTKDFEDLVLERLNKTKINTYEFKNITLKTLRPFHQLVILHLLEKLNAERNSLKVTPLFS